MNTVALSGTVRTTIGSKDAVQLRRDKRVPCVLYGGKNVVHFSVDEVALNKLVFTPDVNGIELELGSNKTLAMIKDTQFNPITDRVEHVDFMELDEKLPTRVVLAVRLKGQPIGVRKGGKLNQSMRNVRAKGLPAHIPQLLEVDVTGMDLNHSLRVKDLKFEGLTMLERAEDVIVSVKQGKKVEVKADEADAKKGAKK